MTRLDVVAESATAFSLDRESDAIFAAIDFLHHGW